MKRIYSAVRSLWLRLLVTSRSRARAAVVLGLVLCSTLPAAAAFKVDIQGQSFGNTNWSGGPLLNWRELDAIPSRLLFTGGPQTNYVVIISFDHTKVTSRGIEDLVGFSPSTNVLINSGPTLAAPVGVDIWTYTLNVTVTNAAPAEVLFNTKLSAGSHNFAGASLAMSLNGPGQIQIQKPVVTLGSPDMAINKVGATQAKTNQILTYVITYTNKLITADTATGVQVIDTLPAQVAYVPNSANKSGKLVGNTLTWSLGNLAPGKSGLLTYKVVVTNNIPVTTTFANYAQILSSQDDANPVDNAASVTTTVVVIPTPLAADDYYAIGKNQPLSVTAPGVMLNDSNAVTASLLGGTANGTLTFNTNGSFNYVPDANFVGTDIFAYQSLNSSNVSGPAIVTIDVTNNCFLIGTLNTTTNNDPGQCGAVVNFALPVTTGDCTQLAFSPTNGSFFPVGTTTVTFTNTDGLSNSFQVTVVDTELPTIICPGDLVLSADAGQCSRSNVTFTITSGDNCPGSSMLQVSGLPSGATFPAGTTTNQFIVTDASGNSASCVSTVTIADNDGPTITCPANLVVSTAAGQCASNVTFSITATDACGSVANLVSVPASGSAFPIGVTTVTNTATDDSGNTSTCTFTVTVVDAQPPTITCPASVIVAANNGSCVATNVNLGALISGDNCGVASVTSNAPANFPVGTNLVTWTVTDLNGNTATCQQLVIVNDNQPPVITCPVDVTVNASTGSCSVASVVLGSPTASDNCGVVTVTNNAPAQFPVGTNVVTWTVTDASGNTTACQQRVIVRDSQPPTINCPTSLVLEADPGQCSRSNVTFVVTASDNCGAVSVVSLPPSGSTFPLGTTTVTNIATDASGNQTICTFTVNAFSVTINDTQPPVITCPTNLVLTADPGQCSRSNVTFLVTATDNCSVTNLVSVPPSGSSFPIGVTTVTNIATDAGGNQALCTFTVTVRDNQGPVITCPASLVVNAVAGQCVSNLTFSVTANDACGSVTNLVSVPASGSTFPVGVTTVTNTATDNSGNVTTCTFTVTVRDNQGPVITCPANLVINAAVGQCTSNVNFSVTATDACGSVTNLVSVPASGSAFPVGVTTVTNTATDNIGNTSTCTFTVTVRDNQGPVITCPANLVVNVAAGQCVSNVTFSVTTTDACGSVTNLVSVPASGSAFPVGVTTVTNTATDNSGNTSTCTFTVMVRDNQPPTITCPANVSVVAPPGQPSTNVNFSVTATDVCGSITNLASVPASGSAFPIGVTTVTNTATDNSGNTSTCMFTVTVTAGNSQPAANAQNLTTSEDTALPIALTGSDLDGNPLTFSVVSGPASGVLSGFNTNTGALTYTPGTNFNGGDSFTFRVNDGTTNSPPAVVSITVTPVNDAPVAVNDFATTPKNVPLTLFVLLNDYDVDGDTLTITTATATNGAVSILGGTNLLFTPASNFVGVASVGYTITDGNGGFSTAPGAVSITVGTNVPPVANNDIVTTPEDTAITFDPRLNDIDPDGDPMTIASVVATNGTVTLLGGTNVAYLPPTNFFGAVTLVYTIGDGNGGTATALITVNVTPVNDVPFANGQSVSTPEDTALPIALTGSDVEGAPLTYLLVAGPGNGSLSGFNTNTGALTYTPSTNYNGPDSFTFRTSDGTNTSTIATVSITVTPLNDTPGANNQNVFTTEDTAAPITLTGSDVEGSPLTFILVSGPANGVISGFNTNTGALTYTPNTNFNGADAFTFRVSDGTNLSAVATVSITVLPVADEPRSVGQGLITPEDTALPITLIGTSPDGNPLTYQLVSAPTHGAFVSFNTNSGVLTYLPVTNYNGGDAFTFRVSDGITNSLVATVSITVTPVTEPPIIVNDFTNTPSGQPVVIPPLVNDTDPDGGTLVISCVSATNGTAIISGTNIIYTPASNYIGTVSVIYCATNQTGGSGSAVIAVTVTLPGNPTFAINQGTNYLNPQTGLFEQRVTITNTGVITASALRLLVGNINSPLGVPRTNVYLFNATGTNVDSRPYVLYNAPLNPGQSVTMTLEFVVPDRRAFTNSLEVVAVLPVPASTNSGSGVQVDRTFVDNRFAPARFVIEWISIPGRTYTVIYSDDNLTTWHAATPSVTAVNSRTQWYDDGPPKTVSPPLTQGSRFYRVILAPANP